MFDRLSIRTKLIAMVAAPLAVVVLLAGLGFTQRRDDAAATREDVRRLETIEASLALQYELQIENLFSVGYLASDGVLHAEDLGAQQDKTDAAAAAYEKTLDALGDEAAVPAGRSPVRQIGFLDSSLRREVEEQLLTWTYADQLYGALQSALFPVNDRLAAAITDVDVSAGARSMVSLGRYSATTAAIGTALQGAAADGGFTTEDGADVRRGFLEAVERGVTELAVVGAQAAPEVRTRLRNQMVGGDVTFFNDQVSFVADMARGTDLEIDPARWSNATQATLTQLRDITTAEAETSLAAANDRASQSESAARLFLAGALLIIVAAVALALYVAASIARPLLSLTKAADEVATEQLPRMVEALRNPSEDSVEHLRPEMTSLDVGGGKELAALSASVSSIQAVAVDVATEQAALLRKGIGDMFVNLARRNQALLDRQLEFIDELEAAEEDPDGLESLFKLDHMATRMRRNAESLLVLAGAEPSRRRGRPVPLTKVTLAAVGEIEHFARIDLLEVDECEVTSKAAADIAHLLSELMENATQFSPPETRVEIVGHQMKAGGYTISITDQGIGMSPAQLTEANDMLAHPPLLGLTLARTLGFIVVGRLAARHKIGVRLVASPAGGVTAIVSLPTAVLVGAATPDTLDLTHEAPTSGRGPVMGLDSRSAVPLPPAPVPVPAGAPPNPSSILPPFEFGSEDGPGAEPDDVYPDPFNAPATLEEALPSGRTFEDGLSRVVPEEVAAPASAEAEVTPLFTTPSTGPTGPEPLPDDLLSPVDRSTPGDAPLPGGPPPVTEHRLFGAAPAAPPASTAPSGGTHLFRTPPEPPAALPSRPATPPSVTEEEVPAPATTEPTPTAEDAPTPAPELTSAGLVKRVPRAAGAKRAVPGSDGGSRAGTTGSTRSPDEVRSMLSRFHSGRQAAQSPGSDAPSSEASGPTPPPPEES